MLYEKISVIVPIYKTEKCLKKCVDSIINQTYQNLEIILVDDGSPDQCPVICDEYAKHDSRIKVIHKSNHGLSEARNSGLEIATGKYIAFADSDDWVERDIYEVLYKAIKESNAELAVCGAIVEYENGRIDSASLSKTNTVFEKKEFLKLLCSMANGAGYAWNKLYHAKTIGSLQYLVNDGCSEDICFNYRYVHSVKCVAYVAECKYHYVKRPGSITREVFNDNAMSIVNATKSFMLDQKDNAEIYPYCIKGYTDASFTMLSGVITSRKCVDRYDELRDGLISCKKVIMLGGKHSLKDKVKVNLLHFSKTLYNFVIRRKRGA